MRKKMKILVAYDGSKCADVAIDDLRRAGLPPEAEALIISVSERWLPPAGNQNIEASGRRDEQALTQAREAGERIKSAFLAWEVQAESYTGSPAGEIIKKANDWKPDLIVMGSHGHDAFERFLLGSVSLRVANLAPCSVRIARGHAKEKEAPVRLVIGVDGSEMAKASVRVVSARAWPKGTEARLITSIGPFYHERENDETRERAHAQQIQQVAASELSQAGIKVSSVIEERDPKQLLLDEAEAWDADCIFIGASEHSQTGQAPLGSVALAVITRAHCPVEVVRAETAA